MSGSPTHDVLIVGAGPHALTMARYLACAGMSATVLGDEDWCAAWRRRMRRLDVGMLRSHHTQHPDPDQYALARFGGDPIQAWAGPWSTPTTDIFNRFCDHIVGAHGLGDVLVRDRALRILPGAGGLRVRTQAGAEIHARHVVLATNPARSRVPGWAAATSGSAPPGRIVHSDDLALDDQAVHGERVLVVGGGLTGAGIAVGAARRGAHATLATRRPLVIRVADAESNWHGPARLRGYFAERDPERRLRMSRDARGGGSVTPAVADELRELVEAGSATLRAASEIECATWRDGAFDALIDGRTQRFEHIWLATGHALSALDEPLLHDIADAHRAHLVDGLPALDDACRWPGTELHLMGALAELQLGPLARNLAGARMAADRVISRLAPGAPAAYPRPAPTPMGRRSRRTAAAPSATQRTAA